LVGHQRKKMSQQKISGVYKITNKLNGKHYIGVSINIKSRWSNHRNINSEKVSYIKNAIKKHGIDSFEFSIIEECHKDLFEERERYWIDFYQSMTNGYNLTAGGSIRKELSEQTRLQMSAKSKGVPKSKEHIAKITIANRSESVRLTISAKLTGRKLSEATKAKMSASKMGHAVSRESIDKMLKTKLANLSQKVLQLDKPRMGRPPKDKNGTERTEVNSSSGD
jgi:group I intron endonuclease